MFILSSLKASKEGGISVTMYGSRQDNRNLNGFEIQTGKPVFSLTVYYLEVIKLQTDMILKLYFGTEQNFEHFNVK